MVADFSSVQGPIFNFEPDPNMLLGTLDGFNQMVNGFRQAADIWSSVLADSVVVNIQITSVQDDDLVLGAALPAMTKVNYKDFLEVTYKDITSEDDWKAFSEGLQLNQDDKDELLNWGTDPGINNDKIKFETKEFAVRMDSLSKEAIKSGNGDPTLIDAIGNENN